MTPNFEDTHHDRIYPSKILLFGEYTVLLGSSALAIPCHNYYGKWGYGISQNFDDLTHYLCNLFEEEKHFDFDKQKWDKSLSNNLYFESNIPIGYGLGSSGSFVAGVYQDFIINKKRENSMNDLIPLFSKMESFFHGKSSGFDPLVSYTDKVIWNKIETKEIVNIEQLPLEHLFLLDSEINRNTSFLVNQFNAKLSENLFRSKVEKLKDKVESIISLFVDNDNKWKKIYKEISQIQLELFDEFIPGNIKSYWEEGLEKETHYTKLCGAGGGGFFLVYSEKKMDSNKLIALKS